jgi:hypothetical protein
MQITLGRESLATRDITNAGKRAAERAARISISPAAAVSCYCAGMLIETVGVALVAAYGWLFIGALLVVGGIALATFGNRRWPEPEGVVSLTDYLKTYVRGGGR